MIFRRRSAAGCASCGARPADPDPVLRCPACGAESSYVTPAMAHLTVREGRQARACERCEQVTVVVEPEMVCTSCARMRPDVNDMLRARYADAGPGDPADAPCVGCGYYPTDPFPTSPSVDVLVDCHGCADEIAVPEDAFVVGGGMHLKCGVCATVTEIPATVWCPKCGLHLRADGLAEVIAAANGGR